MNNNPNPYAAGGPVGGTPAFFGREDVLRAVVGSLLHSQDSIIVLYGQRGIGKTSILQSLASWLPRGFPYRAVYFDWQDKAAWPPARLLQELGRAIAGALETDAPEMLPAGTAAFKEWLPGALKTLPSGHSLVLLLDGFDVLADWETEQIAADTWPHLRRALADHAERLKCIVAVGQATSDLTNVALSFFPSISFQRVSLLTRKDAADLARLSEKKGSLAWSNDAVDTVWQLTHGHPLLVQLLCAQVWERAYKMHPGGPPAASWTDVDAAAPDALEAGHELLTWMWDGLPLAEQVIISTLAQAGPDPISTERLEQLLRAGGAHILVREMQSLAQLLQDWDWIEPAQEGYCFRVELLRRWAAEHKPPEQVREQIGRINPAVDNIYRAAWTFYRGGQLEHAGGLLRQIVAANPAHASATQLLADILVAQGQAAKAQQLLERLYERQPAAARARLAQALLNEARAAKTPEQQLSHYERVLELAPGHPEAAAKVAELKQARRSSDMQARLQQLEGLEQTKQYQAALDLAQWLADEYADLRDWAPDLERLQHKAELADVYRQALEALRKGDRGLAQRLLIRVITVDPGYGQATRYLHLIVTNADLAEVQAELQAQQPPEPAAGSQAANSNGHAEPNQ